MMKVLAVIIVSMLLMGALAPSSIYFQDDFATMDDWYVLQGDGAVLYDGIFTGNDTSFRKSVVIFNLKDAYYEIVIDDVDGTWGISFTSIDNELHVLYEDIDYSDTFTGKMLNAVNVDGVVIEVQGKVDFGSIKIYSQVGSGNPLADWSDIINEIMSANPWVAPTGLSVIILLVGILLLFGKKRR